MREMRVFAVALLVCAAGLAWPGAANGQATLVLDQRSIEAELELEDFGGVTQGGPTTFTPTSMGATFDDGFGYSGDSPAYAAEGECFVTQVSAFDSVPNFTSVVASGTTYAMASTDYDAIYAEAGAESLLQFQFTLSAAMDYEFSGTLDESAGSGATIRARLRPVSGANIFLADAEGPFFSEGTLQPGTYEVHVFAASLGAITDLAYFNRHASFEDVEFTLIPEPGALGLLALGLPLLRRRRAR
ncbi:MAG: hypothetical protein JXB13_00620 [Phycisphaerae bacterium]|nr:hypothetical protein [Phycisphaerae bacterium]